MDPRRKDTTRTCRACGSVVKEQMYQMRAADEAHTSVWSCGMCPLDPQRISFGDPKPVVHQSYPRRLHVKAPSGSKCASQKPTRTSAFLEVTLTDMPRLAINASALPNVRHPCSVPSDKYACPSRAHFYDRGLFAGEIVCLTSTEEISPKCTVKQVSCYNAEESLVLGYPETDGTVSELRLPRERTLYVHSRTINGRSAYAVIVPMTRNDLQNVRKAVLDFLEAGPRWPSITGFITRSHLASINNLSPRAWDSKRIQKKGAVYTPKVDGERVYVLVFKGMMHVFSKGKGHLHVGCAILERRVLSEVPIVVDAENTVSHGMFLIDMLTSSEGQPAPRERDYSWSIQQFNELQKLTGCSIAKVKPYVRTLLEAEMISLRAKYPTDGVIALWPHTTTSRKMKMEKSVELRVENDETLCTSDGDVVFEGVALPIGVERGEIVEARFKLCDDGKEVMMKPLFRRVDKTSANSTSAVTAVLSSFGCVKRDDEARRREVLIWCDSLRQHIFKSALNRRGSRKIVVDVGTGTGQSLDVLSPDRGVSYLLVEPSAQKCEMLKRRTGTHKVMVDAKEIMSVIRSLKSGSQVYAIANMELSRITSDEELMKLISGEIAFVSATFSAHFVTAELYDLCTYWGVPMAGCMYAYNDVEVGLFLVKALGVSMKRVSNAECSVKWGGDEEYPEPYTVTQEYQPFCSLSKGIDIVCPPNKESDEEAWNICSKVWIIENFQGR